MKDKKADDENKLLPALSPEAFKNAPVRDLVEALYWQVIQTQVLVLKVQGDTKRIKHLEEALSRTTYMKSRFFKLRYDQSQRILSISPKFEIQFKEGSQEALLLGVMFSKKLMKPKKTKWQCSEVTDGLRTQGYKIEKDDSVYKAIIRINNRIRKETDIEGLINVTRKQFFIVNTQ